MIRHLHHVHGKVKPEMTCRKRKSGAPLPGTGLGGDICDTLLLGIVGLRYRGVELMRADRAYTFILKIYVGRGVEQFFKPARTDKRRRSPYPVHLAHLVGNTDPLVGIIKFLTRHLFREKREEILRLQRLLCHGVKQRARLIRHVGHHVIPRLRYVSFLQNKFLRFHKQLII